jgi:hypothetical protein
VASAFGKDVVAVLVDMGMRSDSLKPIRSRVLEEASRRGRSSTLRPGPGLDDRGTGSDRQGSPVRCPTNPITR